MLRGGFSFAEVLLTMDYIDKIEINGTLYGLQTLDSGDAYREPQNDNTANIKLVDGEVVPGLLLQTIDTASKANDNVIVFNAYFDLEFDQNWYNNQFGGIIEIPLLDIPNSLLNYSRKGSKTIQAVGVNTQQEVGINAYLDENTVNTNYRQVLNIFKPNSSTPATADTYYLGVGISFVLLRSTNVFYGFVEFSSL